LDGGFDRRMWGTIAVNIAGSFLLGLLSGADTNTLQIVGVGGLGALTTFSTFVSQIECIHREGTNRDAVLYAVGSIVAGIGAAYIGYKLQS
jgi:CrcB protein